MSVGMMKRFPLLGIGDAYLVRDDSGVPHYLVFHCPCGSPVERGLGGHSSIVQLDVRDNHGLDSVDPLTVSGSVSHYHRYWLGDGKGYFEGNCHFHIKGGLIEWC